MPTRNLTRIALTALLGIANAPAAAQGDAAVRSLADLSLEELGSIEVFSATRHVEPTRGVPSAIFVLTGEDLRRTGVTNIPDALRLVPGVQVGRVDANKWAVSMRGFNSREANKLLVLVDGRSVYDPLFSGMLWEAQDFLLEDVERIEVIRGPGGTLWGANAFNGIINIITRRAAETVGAYTSLTIGNEDEYIAAARYGWRAGERQNARVYAKARERDAGYSADYGPADESHNVLAGFRWDWLGDTSDELSVSGEVFDATAGMRQDLTLVDEIEHRSRHVLLQWLHRGASGNRWRIKFYYDSADYDSSGFVQDRSTYDLEFQQNLSAGERHLVTWGGAWRRTRDHALSKLSGFVDVLPARRDDLLTALFVQDAFALLQDELRLTVGVKHEDTDYADAQWLPSVRLAWTPTLERTWWAAVSDAVRVPSRLEADLTFLGTIRIGDELDVEEVRAYEVGHRRLVSSRLWYDAALFYNDYDKLRTTEADGRLLNLMRGQTWGAELALRWEPRSNLRIDAAYTYLDMDLELDGSSTSNPSSVALHEGLAARHQVTLRTIFDVTRTVDVDTTIRFVDELGAIDVPAYAQLDVALGWQPRADWALSLVGSNLLDDRQPEQDFVLSGGLPTQVERAFYFKATWRR